MKRFYILMLLLLAPLAEAQTVDDIKRELSAIDERYMQDRRADLDAVARSNFGRQFNGDPENDMRLIQLLLDRNTVRPEQRMLLQAMGYVLGDILVKKHRVRWIIFEDRVGRSRALEVDGKPDVVFPATAISRRAETGAKVDVQAVYERLVSEIEFIRQRFYVR